MKINNSATQRRPGKDSAGRGGVGVALEVEKEGSALKVTFMTAIATKQ